MTWKRLLCFLGFHGRDIDSPMIHYSLRGFVTLCSRGCGGKVFWRL